MATAGIYPVSDAEPAPSAKASLDERELVERLRRGEAEAAMVFHDRYAPRIHRFIAHSLAGRPPADIEDLLQETMMALAEALPFFRGDSSLFTFSCAVAHRKIASFLRAMSRWERLFSSWAASLPGAVPDEQGPLNETALALSRVKPDYRELLILKYVEELTTAEIKSVLGISEHAVESRLARARRALRKQIGGEI